jgi:radical SAM superfamily enzyme YgiQ (UPF0313 family)
VARVALVTSGLEHLGVAALSAYVRSRGHEVALVYESKPFSSNSGPDNALLARLLEPTPEETAERVAATKPDVIAFSSYTVTHRWSVDVARAVKRQRPVPIVFGGPHVSGAPAASIRETAIDAVVEGEGEGALVDLLECAERDRFARSDVPNTWVRRDDEVIRNPLRPLIEDLDSLPYADKEGFYASIPAFEREFYVVARRGCPYRCSFCEYSTFGEQYPGAKAVRRRSVRHLVDEIAGWKRRGRMRKVFFWDAIFTLDQRWIDEFAEAYRAEIGLPFECYTHPHAMSPAMARALARAGASLVRIGVQSVNADTLAAMNRRGDRERVQRAVEAMRDAGVAYSLDHILGLAGESADDQRDAIRFYNEVRPGRIITHWMTYFPGTTALEQARTDGILSPEQYDRIVTGEQTEGFDAPRLVGESQHADSLREIEQLSVLFELMPIARQEWISWLLESGGYQYLPNPAALKSFVAAAQSIVGDVGTRERVRVLFQAAAWSAGRSWLRRVLTSFARPASSAANAVLGSTRKSSGERPARVSPPAIDPSKRTRKVALPTVR